MRFFITVLLFANALIACGGEPALVEADAGQRIRRGDAAVEASVPIVDAGMPIVRDAEPDVFVSPYTGAPILAPAEQWSYIPFAGSKCGNGSSTGISINPGTNPDNVVIFLMGGGACWNGVTCLSGAASNTETKVEGPEQLADIARGSIIFDRTGPFADASFVFVPYCTADVHAGDSIKNYTILGNSKTVHHKGAANMEVFLQRLVPTYAKAKRVLLTGVSAGGFGAILNFDRIKRAFPGARISVLDDSGPPMTPGLGQWAEMRTAWNLTMPAACTGCDMNLDNVVPYLEGLAGPERIALASFTEDQVIRSFFLYPTASQFRSDLFALRSKLGPKFRSFFVTGSEHVMIRSSPAPTVSGLFYGDWVRQFWNDDPAWSQIGP
jgi:Pectinacetylesterase